MSTFVMVHGAWHGGWCWRDVADPLRQLGHNVYAPSLTGLADRAHLLTSDVDLETHVTDISSLIVWEDLQEVVLCGHSYGGAVVTRVADEIPDRLGAIVYLDAFRPADGETIVELAGWDVPVEETMAPPPAAVLGLEGENAAFVERKMMPHPSRALTARMRGRKPLATHIAPTYVLATGWHGVPHFTAVYEEARTDSRWTSMLVDSSHDPMIDRPQVVVDVLMTAAGRRSAL
jgi:pimeloyl-ACP methyl ester carboxylesterase